MNWEDNRYPIKYHVEHRMLCYWYGVVSGAKSKISYIMYNMLYCLDNNGIFNSGWISVIKQLQEFLSHAYNGLQTVSDLVKEQTETADYLNISEAFCYSIC